MEKMPVCPYCKEKMRPIHYVGYYDNFCFWECGCTEIPGAEEETGQYV